MTKETVRLVVPIESLVEAIASLGLEEKRRLRQLLDEQIAQQEKQTTQASRPHRRGRLFPEITISKEEQARLDAERQAIYQRCQAIFERVQPELIDDHYNWYIAIEPDSGDYFIDADIEVATQKARQKYPDAIPSLFRLNETGACGRI